MRNNNVFLFGREKCRYFIKIYDGENCDLFLPQALLDIFNQEGISYTLCKPQHSMDEDVHIWPDYNEDVVKAQVWVSVSYTEEFEKWLREQWLNPLFYELVPSREHKLYRAWEAGGVFDRQIYLGKAANGVKELFVAPAIYEALKPWEAEYGIRKVESRLRNQPMITKMPPTYLDFMNSTNTVTITADKFGDMHELLDNMGYMFDTVIFVADKPEYIEPEVPYDAERELLNIDTTFIPVPTVNMVDLMNNMRTLKGTTTTDYFRENISVQYFKGMDTIQCGFVEVCQDKNGTPLFGAWSMDSPNMFYILYMSMLGYILVDPDKF